MILSVFLSLNLFIIENQIENEEAKENPSDQKEISNEKDDEGKYQFLISLYF